MRKTTAKKRRVMIAASQISRFRTIIPGVVRRIASRLGLALL